MNTSEFECRISCSVRPPKVRDGQLAYLMPKFLIRKRHELALTISLMTHRRLFGEVYAGLQPDYFWDMPAESGVYLSPMIPTSDLIPGARNPGDIDLLILPYEGDTLILHRVVAVEIKVLRASYAKQGKSPNDFGVSQAQGLLALGFPYVALIHLIVSDITAARNELVEAGVIRTRKIDAVSWYHLKETPEEHIIERLAEQAPTYSEIVSDKFTKRMGQTLEITVQRALEIGASLDHFGRFTDLGEHDDSTLYRKEEPPSHLGSRHLPGKQRLDFVVRAHGEGNLWAGVEVKNTRPWIYPKQEELMELLRKCTALDIVPVLIARRIPYVTGHLFRRCGLVMWETLRQRYPVSDTELADRARHKRILGFADISVGNEPDGPLLKFIGTNLPKVIPEARERFDEYKDLMTPYAFGEMSYNEFAARVRRRSEGREEDFDIPLEDWLEPPW